MSLWSLIYQQRVFKRYHSDKHFSQIFFLQDGGQNQLNKITSLSPYVYVFLGCIYKSDSLDAGASGAAGRANVALCPARSLPNNLRKAELRGATAGEWQRCWQSLHGMMAEQTTWIINDTTWVSDHATIADDDAYPAFPVSRKWLVLQPRK